MLSSLLEGKAWTRLGYDFVQYSKNIFCAFVIGTLIVDELALTEEAIQLEA